MRHHPCERRPSRAEHGLAVEVRLCARGRWTALLSGVSTVAALLLVLLVLAPSPASAQGDVARYQERLDTLNTTIKDLEKRYINSALLERRYRVETRINDGRVFYLLKDYDRASIVFLDLVHNPAIKGTPAHRDALFYLGDSLYHLNNLIGARRHFKELVDEGAGDYYADALTRLIEIATRTAEYDQVEELYRTAKREPSAMTPALRYAYGKSLFFQEKYTDAVLIFEQVPAESDVGIEAIYFIGTARAKMAADDKDADGFRKAMEPFGRVIGLATQRPEDPDAERLMELAHLSRGRLHYELAEYDKAVNEYQFVPRTSPDFDRALYEITWTLIKAGNMKAAQRNLDVLLLSDPDSALAPESRLLRGDLLLRLGEYDDAVETYRELVGSYEPIRDRMNHVMERPDGPKAYFDALVGRDVGALETIDLPGIVEAWIRDDPKMARTLGVATDLETGRQDVAESVEIIAELEDVINSRSKIEIFPELKEGWGRALEVETQLISLKRELVDLEAKLVLKRASGADKSAWDSAHAERERLQKAYNDIPKSRADISAREKAVQKQLNDLKLEVYRLGYDIDSMRAQLVAMNKWLDDLKAEGGKPRADEATIRESMQQHEALVEELEKERIRLRRVVSRASAQTGINDDVAEQEQVLKKEYRAALSRERQALSRIRGGLSGDDASTVQSIDGLHGRVLAIEGSMQSYFDQLDQLVDDKVAEIRREVDVEKARISQYGSTLDSFSGDSEDLAGEIAVDNFQRVQDKFTDLILKADIGVIDVAWKQKEDKSERIKHLFELKGNDLKRLDNVFEDVRRDQE